MSERCLHCAIAVAVNEFSDGKGVDAADLFEALADVLGDQLHDLSLAERCAGLGLFGKMVGARLRELDQAAVGASAAVH